MKEYYNDVYVKNGSLLGSGLKHLIAGLPSYPILHVQIGLCILA